jgi:plastocyanin
MRNSLNRWAQFGAGVVAIAAAASVACGGGSNDKKSPTAAASQTAPTTSATKPAATPATTSAATKPAATATQGAATPGSGEATTLTLIAKDTLFDKSELKAKPGTVTIQMDNQDDGIPHNIHVYKGKDNTGQDLGKTDIEAGPVKQTLTLELTAGEYFFVCDVHPATAAGKLEVG